jgi:hypothetical protein
VRVGRREHVRVVEAPVVEVLGLRGDQFRDHLTGVLRLERADLRVQQEPADRIFRLPSRSLQSVPTISLDTFYHGIDNHGLDL